MSTFNIKFSCMLAWNSFMLINLQHIYVNMQHATCCMSTYRSCILTIISLVCKYATIIDDFVFFFKNQTQNQVRFRIVTGGGWDVLKPRGGSLPGVLAVSLCPKSVWPTFKDRCLSLERFCNDAKVVLGRIYTKL